MPALTGTFAADFSPFYEACDRAVVKLTGFEGGAAKVEKSLNRMADSFSGTKLIQDATLMAEAVERIGGASQLTYSELQRVGAKAQEAAEKIRALGGEVPANIQHLADASKNAAAGTDSWAASVGKLVVGFVSAQAIMSALSSAWSTFTGLIEGSIAAAEGAEVAHAQMVAALQAQGTALPSVVTAYDAYATALQKTTVYSDDAITASEALLTQVGNVMPRDMKKALEAATNLASGLRIDLHDATMLVAKAAEGNVGALKKSGVVIDETAGKVKDFGVVLDAINAKFAGQAEVLAGTYQGRLLQFANTWDNVKESIGRAVTENATVLRAIELVNGAIDTNTGELKDNATATNLISDAVILLAKGFDLTLAAIDGMIKGYAALDRAGTAAATNLLTAFSKVTDTMLTVANATKYLNPQFYTGQLATNMAALAVASQTLHTRLTEIGAASTATQESTQRWSTSIASTREGLAGMITQLEATRGQTMATTAATTGSADAWDRHTVSVTANGEAAKQAATEAKAMEEQQNRATTIVEGKIFEITKAWAGYAAAVAAASHDTTQKQIDDVYRNAEAQITQMERAKTGSIQAYQAIQAAADQLAANIKQKTIEEDSTTLAHYQLVADKAQAAYAFALANSGQYTDARIQQLQTEADAATTALQNWSRNAVIEVEKIKKPADEAAKAIKGMHDQILEMKNIGTKLPGSEQITDSMGKKYLISPTGQRVPLGEHGELPGNWFEQYTGQSSFSEAYSPLLPSGRILPGGQRSNVVQVNSGAIQMMFPIANNPAAMDQLANVVGDALMARITRTGTVV